MLPWKQQVIFVFYGKCPSWNTSLYKDTFPEECQQNSQTKDRFGNSVQHHRIYPCTRIDLSNAIFSYGVRVMRKKFMMSNCIVISIKVLPRRLKYKFPFFKASETGFPQVQVQLASQWRVLSVCLSLQNELEFKLK